LFLYERLNRSIESKVFLNADHNTVLTEKIKQQYISLFPEACHKITVNHNVYMANSFDYEKESNPNTIRFLFLGTLTEEIRSPKRMLSVFDKLIKKCPEYNFTLDFYGEFTDTISTFNEYPQLLNKSVFLHGFITRDEVNLAIKNADVLLNVGNKNEYQEPSKLIEYMYSGKKILNFCSIEADTSLELLEKYSLKFSVLANDKCDVDLLTNILKFLNSSNVIDKESLKIILKDYLLDEVADRYMNIIKKDFK
jgi:glycosyltransferase involved in cell wall biosynthesis